MGRGSVVASSDERGLRFQRAMGTGHGLSELARVAREVA